MPICNRDEALEHSITIYDAPLRCVALSHYRLRFEVLDSQGRFKTNDYRKKSSLLPNPAGLYADLTLPPTNEAVEKPPHCD